MHRSSNNHLQFYIKTRFWTTLFKAVVVSFVWTPEQKVVFNQIKKEVSSYKLLLCIHKYECLCFLQTEAFVSQRPMRKTGWILHCIPTPGQLEMFVHLIERIIAHCDFINGSCLKAQSCKFSFIKAFMFFLHEDCRTGT